MTALCPHCHRAIDLVAVADPEARPTRQPLPVDTIEVELALVEAECRAKGIEVKGGRILEKQAAHLLPQSPRTIERWRYGDNPISELIAGRRCVALRRIAELRVSGCSPKLPSKGRNPG